MENASKALLIAGSILIVIVLIAVGMRVLNSTAGVTESSQKTMDATAITNFNMQFVNAGAQIGVTTTLSGNKTLALQQKVLASNAVNTAHKINGKIKNTSINTSKEYSVTTSATAGYISKIDIAEK